MRSENSQALVQAIPMDRLILETDAPWCGIKPTHPGSKIFNDIFLSHILNKNNIRGSFLHTGHKHIETLYPTKKKEKFEMDLLVKDRNEPCMINQVFEVCMLI